MTNPSRPKSEAGTPQVFDWAAAYQRLALFETGSTSEGDVGGERAQDLLRRRAAVLAASEGNDEVGEIAAFVGFTVAGERYAVPVDQVQEVVDAPVLLTLPGGADLLHGIFNYRGMIVAAIRLVRLLGGDADDTGRFMIVVAADDVCVGIPADEVAGIVQIPTADIRPLAIEPGGDTHPSMRGLAVDSRIILDAAYLVGDSRLIVDEDVQMPIRGGKSEGETA